MVSSSEHIGKGELGKEAVGVTTGGSGHGSFVLLVLEGSLTAIYGDEAVEEARERVLEPGILLSVLWLVKCAVYAMYTLVLPPPHLTLPFFIRKGYSQE